MWIVFLAQSGPAGGTSGLFPSPHLALLFLPHIANLGSDSFRAEVPRERRGKKGSRNVRTGLALLWAGNCILWAKQVSFVCRGFLSGELLLGLSGFCTWLSRLQFFDEGKCISISADHLLLPSSAPGNLEAGKESLPLLRPVLPSGLLGQDLDGPVSVCVLSRAGPMWDSQEILRVVSLPTLRVSQQSCQHPRCPPPFSVNGWAARLPSTWFLFSDTRDPPWQERPGRTLLPTRLEMWVHIAHPA